MSAPRPVALSAHAAGDLRAIALLALRTAGADEARTVLARFAAAFDRLARFPAAGVPRADLPGSPRAVIVGEHVVYYRPAADGIRVLRIMHEAGDTMARTGRREELP